MAVSLDLNPRALRVGMQQLDSIQKPCVLHWDMNHFVVLCSTDHGHIEIIDPAYGRRRLSAMETSKHFTGIALEVTPAVGFRPTKADPTLSVLRLAKQIKGLPSIGVQLFCLAATIEVLALVIPYQVQIIIDRAMQPSHTAALMVVTAAFFLIVIVQTFLSIARSWLITWVGSRVSAQWITNLFRHLLKLPLSYFESRDMGDIVSRFASVHTIQGTLTGSFIETILDGILGTLTLAILLVYNGVLTLWIIGAATIYLILRIAAYRVAWAYNEEQIIYAAKQQSLLMEAVRGIQAIKLVNRLGVPISRIENATMESTKHSMYSQRVSLLFASLNKGLFGSLHVLLIGLSALAVINGEFSLGMLVAYLAYARQFTARTSGLVDKVNALVMLRLQAQRVGDIALSREERYMQGNYNGPTERTPQIELRGVAFRYGDHAPWMFEGLNLVIQAGSSIAITGSVGCGKTTLGKIILGLLEPQQGSVRISGIDVRAYGLLRYRDRIGAVMQNDSLFAGTIRENISFFEEDPSIDDVVGAAKVAQIHEDIIRMPMGYDSMIGDMGSALSGGQKQCILLARALYRKPEILLLDESSSHLDLEREYRINEVISGLEMTRIIIAHRRSTIAAADTVFELAKGRLWSGHGGFKGHTRDRNTAQCGGYE